MAGRGPQSFKKRQKEQQRKEKQQEKLARKIERRLNPAKPDEELDGMPGEEQVAPEESEPANQPSQ